MLRLRIPPPVVALFAGLMMWLINRYLPGLSFKLPLAGFLVFLFVAVGLFIELWSVANFIRARTTISPFSPDKSKELVTDGLYQYTRNPMYTGMLLLLTGCGIWLGNPVSLLMLAFFVWYITVFQIKPEEEALQRTFGQQFTDYRNRVRRWFW